MKKRKRNQEDCFIPEINSNSINKPGANVVVQQVKVPSTKAIHIGVSVQVPVTPLLTQLLTHLGEQR